MKRLSWIDLLRGLAVTGMIWTHSANTFLDAALQGQPWFKTWSFYHGLVAPTFFWVAGFMRGLAAAKPGPARPAWPTVKRLLMICGVGYLMHLPWNAVRALSFDASAWQMLFQSDVLQCLAISCLLLVGVEQSVTPLRWRRVNVAVLGMAFVMSTDWMAAVTTGFAPLDGYLGKQHGALFPLFPWFGFAAAGFLCGSFGRLTWWLALLSGVAAFGLPWVPGPSGTVSFFFERLGWVIMIAWAVSLVPTSSRWLASLLLAGRESLVLYVAHLMMIHAIPLWHGQPLQTAIGRTQPILQVVMIFVLLSLLSLLAGWVNERRKARS